MINFPKIFKEDDPTPSNLVLPLLPLRDIVVFPYMVAPLFVGRDKSVKALASAMNNDKRVFLATQTKSGIDNPQTKDISTIGTIGNVLQLLRLPDGTVKALVEGKHRGRVLNFLQNEEFFQVELEEIEEPEVTPAETEALSRNIIDCCTDYAKADKNFSKDLLKKITEMIS